MHADGIKRAVATDATSNTLYSTVRLERTQKFLGYLIFTKCDQGWTYSNMKKPCCSADCYKLKPAGPNTLS